MASVHDEDEFMLITQQGKILRTVARDIRTIGRATQGVRLIEIDADDRVVALARLAEKDDENGTGRHRARLKADTTDSLTREAGMFRPKTSVYLLASMVLAVAALSACSSPNASEENLVRQFFRASGLRDNQTLANFATVSFDPKTEGTVTDFEVTAVSPERTEPLRVIELVQGGHRSRSGQQGVQRKEEDVSGREHRGDRSRAEGRERGPQADGQGCADSGRMDEVARRERRRSEEGVGRAERRCPTRVRSRSSA